MRDVIAKNIIKTRILPSSGEYDDKHNRQANHCAYIIRSGERCKGEDRQFLVDHPQSFLDEIKDVNVVKANSLKYEVYIGNNPRARFFQESKAIEYVLMLNELI